MKITLLTISFLLLSACQNATQEQKLSQNHFNGIIGGKTVAEKSPISYGIVGIYDSQDNAICTGSLISPHHVLTAAHCISSVPTKMKIIFGVNLDKIIDSKNQLLVNYYSRRVTSAKIHPNYKPEEQENKETDWSDIALIKFEGDLPAGYHPVQLLSDGSFVQKNTPAIVAGFGVSDVYTEPVDAKKIKNIEEAIEYGEVVCFDDSYNHCVSVEMYGDGILRQAQAPISSVQESEFRLDESKGQGTCSGDSGGPAYLEIKGQLFLAGITSRGSYLCDEVGIYTFVTPFLNWIHATMSLMP